MIGLGLSPVFQQVGGGGGTPAPSKSLMFYAADSQHLSLSNANLGSYDRSKFSVIFGFCNRGGASNPIIMGKGDSSTTAEWAARFLDSGGRMEFTVHNGTFNAGAEFTIPSYSNNTFYLVKIDFNGDTATAEDRVTASVSGSPVSVTGHASMPATARSTSGNATIGAWDGGISYFDGLIYQPTIVSGYNPDDADVFDADGNLKDLSGLEGVFSLLDASTATYDKIKDLNWTNNNGVGLSTRTPSSLDSAPIPTTNLYRWYDASDTDSLTLNGSDEVLMWADKSAMNDLMVGTSGLEPLGAGSTQNSLNAVNFVRTKQLDWANYMTGATTNHTIFIVAKCDLPSCWLARTPSYGTNFFITGHASLGSAIRMNGSGIGAANTDGSGTDCKLSASVVTPSNAVVYVNGNSDNSTYTSGAHDFAVQEMGNYSSTANDADGLLCELIIYDTDLGNTEREAVEAYLMSKWGIT